MDDEINNDMPSNNEDYMQGNPEGEEVLEMTPEEEKFFNDFNDQDIDNNDPSLGEELIKIYEEEIPFEIRIEGEELMEKSIFESLLCKILISDENIEEFHMKIEICSNKDLYFYYTTEMDIKIFEKIKQNQKLTCNFNNFSDLLIKYLDLCISDTKTFLAVLTIKKDKNAKMELFENLQYKFGELISVSFVPASDDIIRKQISYRYNAMRAVQDMVQNRIDIINGVLKDIDPELITDVKKAISKIKIDTVIRDKPLLQNPNK
jgi:hypothetical protein